MVVIGQSFVNICNIVANHILPEVGVLMVLILSPEKPRLWKVT